MQELEEAREEVSEEASEEVSEEVSEETNDEFVEKENIDDGVENNKDVIDNAFADSASDKSLDNINEMKDSSKTAAKLTEPVLNGNEISSGEKHCGP